MSALLEPTARAAVGVLARAQATGRIPSLVGGVVRDGELAWAAGRGRSVREPSTIGPQPDAGTQYKIGSVTKTMTAVLVMRARERGDLALDDTVGRFLPDGPFADATLRSLLSHSAGITAEPHGAWWERSTGSDRAALVAAHAGAARVLETGSQHHYSNLGFGVLGEVAAEVAGSSWWDALCEQVLSPLGMSRTTYQCEEPYARGWAVDSLTGELVAEPLPDTGTMAPAGQLWSTVADLGTWLTALVDPDRAVLREESLVAMRTPQASTPDDRSGSSYGLGVSITVAGGRMAVGHGGSMPGFTCGVLIDVDSRTGAVVLTNGAYGLDGATRELLDTVLDAEPPLQSEWSPTTGPVPEVVREVLGTWHWGHAPSVLSWDGRRLQLGPAAGPGPTMSFTPTGDPEVFVGTSGYLLGRRCGSSGTPTARSATWAARPSSTPGSPTTPAPPSPRRGDAPDRAR